MRINVIIPFTGITGGIKVIFQYVNGLIEKGHQVNVYVPALSYKFNYNGVSGFFKRIKATIHNCLAWRPVKWFDLKTKVKVVPIISSTFIKDADITIATAWETAYSVNKLSHKKGKKVYFIQHYELWSGKEIDVKGSYDLDLNQIVIDKWLKDLMEKEHNKKSVPIAYNGINSCYFYYGDKNNHEEIKVLIMHHNLEWKGFEDGLKAIKIAKNQIPNIKIIAFGLEDYSDEDVVYYKKPSRDELIKLYRDSDIYVFPSHSEGWGLTVIEAMANKCAVAGTKTGVIESLGKDEVNALISNPKDIDHLANNIIKLSNDSLLRKRISENGFKLAKSLEVSKTIDEFEKILQNISN